MKDKSLKSSFITGIIVICIAAIWWGFDGVVLTPRLFNLDIAFVVLIFHLLPFVIMNSFLFKQYKYLFKFSKSDYFYLGLISLFGGAIGTLSIVKALFLVNFQNLSVVVLLQKFQPIFAIALAAIILKEKLKPKFLTWAGLAIIAGYFLTFGFHTPMFDASTNTTYAALYALLAAFSFGSATVFGRKVVMKYDFKTVSFFRFGFTSLIMLVYLLIFGSFQFSQASSLNWLIFLIIALTSGTTVIFLYYFGLKKVKASVATICELCFPIAAIIFDFVFNHSVLSPVQWIAAAVMIGAIIRISKLKR
ncbi:EamA family transporter [archaeon]|nr:EamA family transporter [archaeon]MBL7057645.1 EamA family transporter [Candidatus Woesearchaeota archaeon]